jgi:hypothetical protein
MSETNRLIHRLRSEVNKYSNRSRSVLPSPFYLARHGLVEAGRRPRAHGRRLGRSPGANPGWRARRRRQLEAGLADDIDHRDLTAGTGRFNLTQGVVGTLTGISAAISTTAIGFIVQRLGDTAGFLTMAGIACIALAALWAFLPESKPAEYLG